MCEANAMGVKHCKILNIELFWHVRTSTLRGRPETNTILYMKREIDSIHTDRDMVHAI